MKTPTIDGIVIQSLKIIPDERGAVLHMLQKSNPIFKNFGEIYFSEINPGSIKAWKRNKKQNQNLTVPVGKIDLVIYDDRPDSTTRGGLFKYELGRPDHYSLVHIPPLLWYGFQGLGQIPALIANCPDQPHDPSQAEKIPSESDFIPHIW
jgi:dTDP-4-dehydrorhamnose 3,5-epimerase